MSDRAHETWTEQGKRLKRERRWELFASLVMFISGLIVTHAVPDRATWPHALLFGAGCFIILFAFCLAVDRGPKQNGH
jgi:fatty acid desaturase